MPTSRARDDASKEERRQRIINAALTAFYERGFAATRMDDVATGAGLSKGTLYLYFPSKETLFESLITELALPRVMQFEQTLEQSPSLPEALDAFFGQVPVLLRHSPLPKLIKILISDARSFPDAIGLYRDRVIKRLLALIRGQLQAAQERGEIAVDDPDITARLVVAPIVFSIIWLVVFEHGDTEPPLDVSRLLAQHRHHLLTALCGAPQQPATG